MPNHTLKFPMVGGDSKFVLTRTHVHKFPHTHTTHISKRKRDRDHTQRSPNGGRYLGKIKINKKNLEKRDFSAGVDRRVWGYGAGVTATKLWGSSSSKMNHLEKWLQESEQMHLEANANANAKVKLLEEQVIQLKDLLEEWSTQME